MNNPTWRSAPPRPGRLASRFLSLLLPRRDLSPREAFQARFLVGANVLALLVAVPSLVGEATIGHPPAVVLIAMFMSASVAMLAALRLGAALGWLVWLQLSVLAVFLTLVSLATVEVQAAQLHWLLLLPLGSMVLIDPRQVRASHLPSTSLPLVASLVAAALGLLIIAAHAIGWTFGAVSGPPNLTMDVLQHLTFIVSAGGLLLLYDRTARENVLELATLRKLLSMCAWCRRIRDEHQGGYVELEQYVATHVSRLTHGICPDCARRHFGPDGEHHP